MTRKLEELLRDEAEYAETHVDAPVTSATTATRPGGRARVFSLRLSADEVAALEAAAERAGIPASTLARGWITDRLATDDGTTDVHAIAEALATFSQRLAAI